MQKILRIERHPAVSDAAVAAAAASSQHAVRLLRRLGEIVNAWAIRRGTRRALAELERHHLLDIGKTHEEVQREAAKPFWRA